MANERKSSADEAGVGPDPRNTRHLMPLKELRRHHIVKGEPDIRGWNVFTSNGRDVGRVAELLVDTSIDEVVMLDIDLTGSGRRLTAPIRAAWIDRPNRRVILDSAELTTESELPTLGRSDQLNAHPLTAEQPRRLVTESSPVAAAPVNTSSTAIPAATRPPAPGSEVVVERRIVAGDAPEEPEDRKLIEEVVLRRRYVDAAELAKLEQSPPPPDAYPPTAS